MLATGGLMIIGRRAGFGRGSTAKLQGPLLYREEQTFGWPWPGMLLVFMGVAMLVAVVVPFGLGMWQQLVLGKPWGDQPMPNLGLAVAGLVAILMSPLPLVAVLLARLRVEVRGDGMRIELLRLRSPQVIRPGEVHAATLTRIGLCGFGASRHGRRLVYRMAGSEGVLVELASGRKVVIGSEHSRALLTAIQAMREPEGRR